ncbi:MULTISPECIES: efflux RND transporter periplasmic adaptor subunit [Thioclava]|uniref:efflux RND transporter periplasmic adaptor subunit n=1 Tax=Thioclava TaxID=285107 RepID=UPI000B548F3C|nr:MULTISPECIES: efflux RND transporter periplasmic adaptor subunit [Thioclava]OWY05620.1 efflux transporter periplasmic adaptor subunit [Thioclava sp. F1Mire-8]OWY10916.1 efflux transporter periplasmic adaptor subunit [Thioclava sp. F42-5]OWY14014.1 efflux transporter periplasmic adaptor subunit [Thioclava sp. F34-6]OWY18080.1 efflux transporter periplasmic adaptor subunit [Thioclava sp. JM3]PWE51286.1 efflux RND transporter periplasmic adaptor subunit [Thioclava sp. NG1]
MTLKLLPLAFAALILPGIALAQDGAITVEPQVVTDWKSVYGQVEAKNTIAARARISGTITALDVTEGDEVKAGQEIGKITDQTLDYQIGAVDAQINALEAQLENAKTELKRGQELQARGVSTSQNVDQLQTQVNVYEGQIAAQKAQRKVYEQQQEFGTVTAPIDGKVVTVPVTKDAVIMGGETIATIGGGGFFLRLSIPERHADTLHTGDTILITDPDGKEIEGKLAKIYPEIEGGRVQADVEVPDLDSRFVGARLLVKLPMGEREALLVPQGYVFNRTGLDFVRVKEEGGTYLRTVVPGVHVTSDGKDMVEVLTGLNAGDTVVPNDEQ